MQHLFSKKLNRKVQNRILGLWKYITDKKEKDFRKDLKKIIGAYPINLSYYKKAFIHKSASYIDHNGKVVNNERLEFLGDAILGAVVGDYIFRLYPNANEGFLTQARAKIVNRKILSHLAKKTGITQFIITHIKRYQYNKYIPGNTLEAFIGAVYLDLGFSITKNFIIRQLLNKKLNLIEIINTENNYKSRILEWGQHNNISINFETKQLTNQPHILFKSNIYLNKELFGEGKGHSKKEAEQAAARKAFIKIETDSYKIYKKIQHIDHSTSN